MTKEQIIAMVKAKLSHDKLKPFLEQLIQDGYYEAKITDGYEGTTTGEDIRIEVCLSDLEDDKDDFGLALAELLGSDA